MAPPSDAASSSFEKISKADIEVLSLEVSEDEAMYRIRARKRVHYLYISAHANPIFDEDTLCRPYLLIPKLPPFPDSDWTEMRLFRGADGDLESTMSFEPLVDIQSRWHPRCIDIISLRRVNSVKQRVQEVEFEGRNVISKTAVFPWLIPQLEHETNVYEMITKSQRPEETPIAPAFLGHLTEQGRTVGFLLERIDGDFASLVNLPECEAALRRLHGMGLVHGDVNRYNFVVEASTGHVKMIDFEHAEAYEEEKARLELEELRAELVEETGKGAVMLVKNGVPVGRAGPIPAVDRR